MPKKLFTSESVTQGHPDKVCDSIADAILDEILKKDKNCRVACEVVCTTGQVQILGEVSSTAEVDYTQIARDVICKIGYNSPILGFDGNSCAVTIQIKNQSEDIALGVNQSMEYKSGDEEQLNLIGAGDQGIVFGFACNETPEYMPLPIVLSNNLARKLHSERENENIPYLRPDGKSQVTVEYDENGKPKRVDTILISAQHDPEATLEQITKDLKSLVIEKVIPSSFLDENTRILINPTGRFVIGGPVGDSGLTGRKIIVDTYGGYGRHGGGSFSGKDPTKVDRSAAYATRYIAKNLVAAGVADKCEIQVAYAIGIAQPISITVDTFGTGKISDEKILKIINKVFDLRPLAIIKNLDLLKPIYSDLSAYGHMGRTDLDLSWEKLDKVDQIKALM
ncbi:MAG: methionine adenosyltransferase [Clostridia bacterium]|nr:methionine adenosyltransferase [Clostridia bacterium]